MHGSAEFLQALATVLCVAAVATVLFQKLHQPVVLGYILAGLIVGPHVPLPLVADSETVRSLSELGVILLMFSLGLEFSLRKLFQLGATSSITAIIQCSAMTSLGFVVGRAFGWSDLESLFAGAIIAISSTTIIAKAFDEQNVRGKQREIVVGILIVEDLIAILLMALLTAVATGSGLSAGALIAPIGRLLAFLVGLIVVGLLVVPRIVRSIAQLERSETTLVASLGICFAITLLTQQLGYSVALGAFLAGSLVAESGEQKTIEHLVEPVRDMFAAVFFVSVGMLIDPALIAEHWLAVLVLTTVVIVGKIASVSLGVLLTGNGIRTSVQSGMSLAQIGEFSFIIAGLGLSLGAIGDFLYPVAVAVSAITTLTTPFLIRASGPVASLVDHVLPRPLQTVATLYASWVENLRGVPEQPTVGADLRRMIGLVLLDVALMAALVIGTSIGLERIASAIAGRLELDLQLARSLVIGAVAALCVPFCVGVFRITHRLAAMLAGQALPTLANGQRVDLAAAPRRALVLILHLVSVLLVGAPFVALTQPFLPGSLLFAIGLALSIAFVIAFWRSATDLQSHVSAGAELILEALRAQSRVATRNPARNLLAGVRTLLPGLGEPTTIRLPPSSPAVGKSLAALNLRGVTGATVLAIQRGPEGVVVPTAQEILRAGDLLALAGAQDAITAARAVLTGETQLPAA